MMLKSKANELKRLAFTYTLCAYIFNVIQWVKTGIALHRYFVI